MAETIPRVGCNLFIKTVTYLCRYDVQLFMLLKIILLLLISNMRVYLHLHVAYGSFLLLFLFSRFWIMYYFMILIEIMCLVTVLNRIQIRVFGTLGAP